MSSPMAWRSYKSKLTRAINVLKLTASKVPKKWLVDEPDVPEIAAGGVPKAISKATGLHEAIVQAINEVNSVLADYASSFEDVESDEEVEKQQRDYECRADEAEQVLDSLSLLPFQLQMVLAGLKSLADQCRASDSEREKLTAEIERLSATHPRQQHLTSQVAQVSPVVDFSRLEPFSGALGEWTPFLRRFKRLIDQNTSLHPWQKLDHLQSLVQGQAKRLISRFELENENYQKALELLSKEYDDQYEVLAALNENLLRAKLREASPQGEKELLFQINELIHKLVENKESVDTVDRQILISSKFSKETQLRLEKKKHKMPERTTLRLLEALGDIIRDNLHVANAMARNARCFNVITIQSHANTHQRSTQSSKSLVPKPDQQKQVRTEQLPKQRSSQCLYCGGQHHLMRCDAGLSLSQKQQKVKEDNRCENCLSKGHAIGTCISTFRCMKCKNKHHTTICPLSGNPPPTSNQKKQPWKAQPDQQTISLATSASGSSSAHLLINTAMVKSKKGNKEATVDVVFDTGSQASFVESSLVKRLNSRRSSTTWLEITAFGGTTTKKLHNVHSVFILDKNKNPYEVELIETDHILSNQKRPMFSKEDLEFMESNNLQVPLGQAAPKILLGCDSLWQFWKFEEKPVILPSNLLVVQTKLGASYTGLQAKSENPNETTVLAIQTCEPPNLEKFMQLETSGTQEYGGSKTEETKLRNKEVMENFQNTVKVVQDATGEAIQVRLPWRRTLSNKSLPTNRSIALKRLQGLIRNRKSTKEVLLEYNQIFKTQLEKGVLEPVDEKAEANGRFVHYLPHQAVFTPQKTTTKLRVVFDASAHFYGQPSLNDFLEPGPQVGPQMLATLIRFRVHKYAATADVEKAFLQIHLDVEDRDACRCIWLKDPLGPAEGSNLQVLRFCRIPFGLAPSPFLLAASLKFHLEQNTRIDANIAHEILSNIYVDNILLTDENPEKLSKKILSAKSAFNEISMNLREFLSNDPRVLQKVRQEDLAKETLAKVLGVEWDSANDELIGSPRSFKPCTTKRQAAAELASFYDPLGLYLPQIVPIKFALQKLWEHGYDWDDQLSMEDQDMWKTAWPTNETVHRFSRSLTNVSSRNILSIFVDASQLGMAAVAYLHSHSATPQLVLSKSKITPSGERITIPKMETNAITLGMRIAWFLVQTFQSKIKVEQLRLFSDSRVALAWVRNHPSPSAGVLVRNRIQEIKKLSAAIQESGTKVHFSHVPTHLNSADLGTRTSFEYATYSQIWWHGPQFLSTYAPQETESSFDFRTEKAVVAIVETSTSEGEAIDQYFARFNSFKKAYRVLAYIKRFIFRSMAQLSPERRQKIQQSLDLKQDAASKHLQKSEVQSAKAFLIRKHQNQNDFRTKYQVLNPKKDDSGIIRCYGRLKASELDEDAKNPILISGCKALIPLIINDAHGKFHQNANSTTATIRDQFWVPHCRTQVKRVLRNCFTCRRNHGRPFKYPVHSQLPERRVSRSRPFEHIGLDYAGPILVKGESNEKTKAYIAIVTCAASRLVHLELVPKADTISFINAFRRFCARRGIPRSITSDNGSQFVLGEQILKEAWKEWHESEEWNQFLSVHEILWHFITPAAPWQGGFYERIVAMVKEPLKSALRNPSSYDTTVTVLCEVENILNSRPITSSDELELRPLRPIDLIMPDYNNNFPWSSIDPSPENDPDFQTATEKQLLKTKHEAQAFLRSTIAKTDAFWKKWREEYLKNLRSFHSERSFKRGVSDIPQIGHVVLIFEDNMPRNQWRLGRVVSLNKPDSQGFPRELSLQLANKRIIKRPTLCAVPLELQTAEEEPDRQNETVGPEKDGATRASTRIRDPPNRLVYSIQTNQPPPFRAWSSLLCTILISLILLPPTSALSLMQFPCCPRALYHVEWYTQSSPTQTTSDNLLVCRMARDLTSMETDEPDTDIPPPPPPKKPTSATPLDKVLGRDLNISQPKSNANPRLGEIEKLLKTISEKQDAVLRRMDESNQRQGRIEEKVTTLHGELLLVKELVGKLSLNASPPADESTMEQLIKKREDLQAALGILRRDAPEQLGYICLFCTKMHNASQCPFFIRVQDRLRIVQQKHACVKCMGFCGMRCLPVECRHCKSTEHHEAVCASQGPGLSELAAVLEQIQTSKQRELRPNRVPPVPRVEDNNQKKFKRDNYSGRGRGNGMGPHRGRGKGDHQ